MLNLLVKSFDRNALASQLVGVAALEDPFLKVTNRVGSIVSLPLFHLHLEKNVGRLHDHVQSFFHTVGTTLLVACHTLLTFRPLAVAGRQPGAQTAKTLVLFSPSLLLCGVARAGARGVIYLKGCSVSDSMLERYSHITSSIIK